MSLGKIGFCSEPCFDGTFSFVQHMFAIILSAQLCREREEEGWSPSLQEGETDSNSPLQDCVLSTIAGVFTGYGMRREGFCPFGFGGDGEEWGRLIVEELLGWN